MGEEDRELTKKERRELAREKKREERERVEKSSGIKKTLLILLALGVLGFLGFKTFKFITAPVEEAQTTPDEITVSDWTIGKIEAKVTLIEYGDFQCPACADYYPWIKRLNGDFPDDLRIVFRHFPLTTIHKNSMLAAKASEAAGMQGKFWEMHDILFEKQTEWANERDPKEKFSEYAKSLELDEGKFLQDLESKEADDLVKGDIFSANRLRITTTPSFYLQGEKVQPKSYEEFKGKVEDQVRGYTVQ